MTEQDRTEWPHAQIEIRNETAHIIYDRRERANALSEASIEDLRHAIEATAARDDVRLVVLRSAGDGAFCAGADVNEMRKLDAVSGERFIRSLHRAFNAIRLHRAPVITVVQGACLGAGLELAISCDFVIASDNAIFGMPEPFVGVPSVIEAALLPHVIGLMQTRDLLLTGETIGAQRALEIGMLTSVHPEVEIETAVSAKAAQLLRHPPRALALQKRLMNRWLNLPMDEAIEAGVKAFTLAVASGEPALAISDYWRARER